MKTKTLGVLLLAVLGLGLRTWAEEDLRRTVEDLQKEVNQLKMQKAGSGAVGSSVLGRIADKDRGYGPDTVVTTKEGRLTIGALLQVWFYDIQNDHYGLFGNSAVPGALNPKAPSDLNDGKAMSSFRIRRTELKFTADIHENVQGVVMIDPSRENKSNPALYSNLGTAYRAPSQNNADAGTNLAVGAQDTNRMLQDAYIRFHNFIPHHEVFIGQYKPMIGYEGIKSSAELDFAERSMIGQLFDARDLGITLAGKWWDERFQYTLGAFDAAENFITGAQQQNRVDTNESKDFVGGLFIRPVWKDETWGDMQIGGGGSVGTHGDEWSKTVLTTPSATRDNQAWRADVYATYKPGGPVAGLWVATEWAWFNDRYSGIRTVTVGADGIARLTASGTLSASSATTPVAPYTTDGWYASIGYKLDKKCEGLAKNLEFLYRYETYENILIQSRDNAIALAANPKLLKREALGIHTNIHTIGMNYYIKGKNAKIQVNYSIVGEDTPNNYAMREVKNNSFVAAFQLAF